MCKFILTPVSKQEFDFYLSSFYEKESHNISYPKFYSRLQFSIEVITNYLNNFSLSIYTFEDVVY